jgi:hypothetical protein
MTRGLVSAAVMVGMLAAALVAGDVLKPGRALADAGPPARGAQVYYPPPPMRPAPTPPTPVQPLRLMNPFPIVRIVGLVTRRGTRIRLLTVRAPVGATIFVRCRRKRCSRRSRARGRGMRKPVRFRRFERRMRAGTIVEVSVGRSDAIGKFTRFRIRAGRRPSRADRCLLPGATAGTPCPE